MNTSGMPMSSSSLWAMYWVSFDTSVARDSAWDVFVLFVFFFLPLVPTKIECFQVNEYVTCAGERVGHD